jgi:hypothetical protein
MGGGLMQLVAYGAQDVYLTGNPQITFFKVVYRRHTNFSMETIQQTINGSSVLTDSTTNSGTVTISRNGDLVHKVYATSSTDGITMGSQMVYEAELEIGGQMIDRQSHEWMDIVNELTTPRSKATGLKNMIGDVGRTSTAATDSGMVQVPLQFWFCRNPGLALPLIALQYHEVKIKFTWGRSSNVGAAANVNVWADYIYLDTDERRRFAQVSHEYLIEQVQVHTARSSRTNRLNFNHPVKELIWTSNRENSYISAKLVLNGHDRFALQSEEYFQLRQPFDYHTAIPNQNLSVAAAASVRSSTRTSLTAAATAVDVADAPRLAAATGIPVVAGECLLLTKVTAGALAAATVFTDVATVAASIDVDTLCYGFGPELSVVPSVGDLVRVVTTGANSKETVVATVLETLFVDAAATQGAAGMLDGNPDAITVLRLSKTLLNVTADNGAGSLADDGFAVTRLDILNSTETATEALTSQMTKKINCYSFALKPEEHQPSGTCNFSRIDTATLETTSPLDATGEDRIYAVNYNVLRIMSGMGGLAYSN